jgi:hypothetical protein
VWKAEQKRFRPLMRESRRDPKDLKPEERRASDRLLIRSPTLKHLYEVRLRLREIFDTAADPATAEQELAQLRARTESLGLDFRKF